MPARGLGITLAGDAVPRPNRNRKSAMNRHKFSSIAHRDHDYCNPIAAAKIEKVLDLLPLEAASRVLDLGCGRAELALRIIERFGSTVIAVDHSDLMLEAARERAQWTGALAKLHLDDTDIRNFEADPETFHLSVMLGAGGIDGGMAGICNRLKGWTRGGGYVLIGEGFWQRKPHPDYLGLLGGDEGQYRDHRGNVQAGVDAGLVPMHATTASIDEWDEYEWKYCRSIERYAREAPDDPDVPAMLDRIRRWRDGYLRWGRDTLGFALYLFYRPGTRMG
jgi:SAM-dependent methyltransferase